MAMRLHRARRLPDGSVHLQIWLDDTRALPDSSPDPAWLVRYDWGPRDSAVHATQAAYETMIRTEARALAQAELASRTPPAGTALAGEGDPLP